MKFMIFAFFTFIVLASAGNKCGKDEQYYENKPDCTNTCQNYPYRDSIFCATSPAGCFCREGLVKRGDGKCVLLEKCNEAKIGCDEDEQYYENKPDCTNTCENYPIRDTIRCATSPAGCFCRVGLVKRKDGKCVPLEMCNHVIFGCGEDEQYYNNKPDCTNTCENYPFRGSLRCAASPAGCFCREGLVKRNDGKCVPLEMCNQECGENEEIVACAKPKWCNTCTIRGNIKLTGCNKGCDCKKGFYRDQNEICIPESMCLIDDEDECVEDNGDCTQICLDLPIGYECQCRPGYYMLPDNRTCEDINECDIPGSCSQTCINIKGGFRCECIDGYMMDPNNSKSCIAKDGGPVILFSNWPEIRKVNIETSEYASVVSNLSSDAVIDYDYRTGTIYLSEFVEDTIKSVPIITGGPVTTIISTGNGPTVFDIAVDWIYGNIYWTDIIKNEIKMCDKTGKMSKTIVSGNLERLIAIVLNPLDGWIYWTDSGVPAKIERAGMDGSHREVLIDTDIKCPNGLARDFVTKKLYWVDAELHTLSSSDFNGDNRRVIMFSPIILKNPVSIDVFEDWVYWTDWETRAMQRMNKFNGEQKMYIVTGRIWPNDIHIYHFYKQPGGINYCKDKNGKCSHLCMPTPYITDYSLRYTCACPDGMKLTTNGMTCVSDDRK